MTFSAGPFGRSPRGGDAAFGFAYAEHHPMHQDRRHARRHLHEQLHQDDAGPVGSFGFGPAGPGFGPVPGPHGGRRGRGRGHGRPGHRGRRGDVRTAILALLAEQPMHGYQMIQEIAERSLDLWRPSPGSVYPTLQLLVDEGLVIGRETDGSKRLFELTDDGRGAAEKIATPPWQEIADGVDPGRVSLRTAVDRLYSAVVQAADAATSEQQQRIVDIVNNARREVYGILGEAD